MDAPIADLETLLARTWPGLEQEHLGDWLLRAGGGWTGRANSALAVGDPGLPRDQALDAVAAWYAARGLVPRVHVARPLDGDPDADALLAACQERGWHPTMWTFVMTRDAPTGALGVPEGLEVTWQDEPGDDWVSLFRGGTLPEVGRAVLTAAPAAYLTARRDGVPVASGRAAVVEDWVVLSAIEVAPDHRRNGLGAWVTEALAWHGAEQGAGRVALQVESGNEAAIRLYERLGYGRHHEYTYCVGA